MPNTPSTAQSRTPTPEPMEMPMAKIDELLLILADDLAADQMEKGRLPELVLRNAAEELSVLRSRALAAEADRDDYQARYRECLENGLRRLNSYNALKATAEEMYAELIRLRAAAEEGK